MNLDVNTVFQGLKNFAETSIVKPANQFMRNQSLEGNYFGRAKIIGKTMAAAYLGGIVGSFIGLPTIAMVGAGIYTFKTENSRYDMFTKFTDRLEMERIISQVSKFSKQVKSLI